MKAHMHAIQSLFAFYNKVLFSPSGSNTNATDLENDKEADNGIEDALGQLDDLDIDFDGLDIPPINGSIHNDNVPPSASWGVTIVGATVAEETQVGAQQKKTQAKRAHKVHAT